MQKYFYKDKVRVKGKNYTKSMQNDPLFPYIFNYRTRSLLQ